MSPITGTGAVGTTTMPPAGSAESGGTPLPGEGTILPPGPKPPPGTGTISPPIQPAIVIKDFVESLFKRLDANGDGRIELGKEIELPNDGIDAVKYKPSPLLRLLSDADNGVNKNGFTSKLELKRLLNSFDVGDQINIGPKESGSVGSHLIVGANDGVLRRTELATFRKLYRNVGETPTPKPPPDLVPHPILPVLDPPTRQPQPIPEDARKKPNTPFIRRTV